MAEVTVRAPSIRFPLHQTALITRARNMADKAELWLELERDQLALWVPVALGTGIGLWFGLPLQIEWIGVILAGLALGLLGFSMGHHRRLGRAMMIYGLLMALGCGLIWLRAWSVSTPVLTRPTIATFSATIESVEVQGARARVRLVLTPDDKTLPPHIRVNVDTDAMPVGLVAGERIKLRARLLPPPEASLPGGYDFARGAWFMQLGATGKAFEVQRINVPVARGDTLHDRLTRLLLKRIPGSAGGVGASFISGDRGAISQADENSMRSSGLTHLVSVSGLHITVAVTGMMLITLRMLSLFPSLALRLPLLGIAATSGAVMGIFYTWLTGGAVPTIRSCVAAVLVIMGLIMGREAVTLRLVATGAVVVLVLWPEALVGPSFQLSFIAVTSIIAFNEHPRARHFIEKREGDALPLRFGREAMSLVITGMVVEAALAPIAFFHFHRSGIYGALANIIGIPLTTFFIMPMEALGLIFEPLHLSMPFWWCANHGLAFLLWISDTTAAVPGAVTMLPDVPVPAFLLVAFGGLWLMLWRSKPRFWGLLPVAIGMVWTLLTPAPDVLVTGDGRHMVVRTDDGKVAILRDRAHDYVRQQLAAREGYAGVLDPLDDAKEARCNDDLCVVKLNRGGRTWTIAAKRSPYNLPWDPFMALCAQTDIFISDRKLPAACQPRWIKADKWMLRANGGLAINLKAGRVETVKSAQDEHPWVVHVADWGNNAPKREEIGD